MNAKAEASPVGALTPAPRSTAVAAHSPRALVPAPRALATDPLSVDDILTGFYRPPQRPLAPLADGGDGADEALKKPRPTHYKVVCISLYNEDIERLDGLVRELKRRGHTKANKSQVIREALLQIDLDKVPRSH